MRDRRFQRDPTRPCYVISVAASMVEVHPRTLRIYEDEGLLTPARTPTNIRLYSENDIRRVLWIRHLTQDRGVNLAGVRLLFELEERLGTRILEALFDEAQARDAGAAAAARAAEESQRARPEAAREHDQAGERIASRNGERDVQPGPPAGSLEEAPAPSPQRHTLTRIVATRVVRTHRNAGDTDD